MTDLDAPQPMNTPGLGLLEHEVMECLWRAGHALIVREVLDKLNSARGQKLAYTTVMTILTRLAGKGSLTRERARRGYRYRPVASDAAGLAVKEVIRDFGDSAVAHFVEEARANPELRRRLAALLKETDEAQPR